MSVGGKDEWMFWGHKDISTSCCPNASEVTTFWHYTKAFITIIIKYYAPCTYCSTFVTMIIIVACKLILLVLCCLWLMLYIVDVFYWTFCTDWGIFCGTISVIYIPLSVSTLTRKVCELWFTILNLAWFCVSHSLSSVSFSCVSDMFVTLENSSSQHICSTKKQTWRCGNGSSVVRRMNEVTLHRAWLVLGWVTVCRRVMYLGM